MKEAEETRLMEEGARILAELRGEVPRVRMTAAERAQLMRELATDDESVAELFGIRTEG